MLSDQNIILLKNCKTDKELKKVFKKIASIEPEKYFPTKELNELGYMRKECVSCGTFFWTTHINRKVCGDPMCSGGFQVVVDNPSKITLSYTDVWKKIVEILEPRGYVPIKRYPSVARWNPTSEFTIASISAFQPYVIAGEMEPPAKKLIIPQFCLRFNDIENVGLTGSHACGFIMIGQHAFMTPNEWNQGELFIDMHDFISEGVGLSKEEITIHEDSWAGGGSFGCSLEFFSRGVELFNQVYTMFEQTQQGPKELKLKVLDMGLGQERVAWFSQGTPNMYEATFPQVLSKLRKITEIDLDLDLYKNFSRYSAYLNADEVDDMDLAWQRVSDELNIPINTLKSKILPMMGLYSIAEHARTLLFAIHDGKLPSNVGGGYNLRVIYRRAIGFIDRFNWNIDIANICEWHAEELKGMFPELSKNLDEIREILEVEKKKYNNTKKKANKILERILRKGEINTELLIEMYDSNGISPDMVKETAKKYNTNIKIPDNFYNLVLERHDRKEQEHATKKAIELNLEGVPETIPLFYSDYTKTQNKGKVLKIIDNNVILDQSVAYPTSGGQLHDIGMINNQKFDNVFKQGNHVIHLLNEKPKFKESEIVNIEVDKSWRKQLTQHHTATHIVNAAARKILGNHINQAGAKKTLKNSHLDITHYEQLSNHQLKKIEEKANEIVNLAIDLNLKFIPRSDAEREYGMQIYQGGAVPGKKLRIVEIPGIDVEACGGTHLNNTKETGKIRIIKSQKIQDGVVRIVFTAGNASEQIINKKIMIISEIKSLLNVNEEEIIGRVSELLIKWKNIKKSLSSGKVNDNDLILNSTDKFKGDNLTKLSEILGVNYNGLIEKIQKIYYEWENSKNKLKKVEKILNEEHLNNLLSNATDYKGYKFVIGIFEKLSKEDLKNINQNILKIEPNSISILINQIDKGILIMGMMGPEPKEKIDLDLGNVIKKCVENYKGKGGGIKDFGQGFIPKIDLSTEVIITYLNKIIFI
ncbi:MAG: alanine--tRNA ligase [Candidatus Lokiarchaeota archaeon]|nr:alanine--tRNA ligase [Candidatus Lokiarchaeota archaeon]